MQTKKILTGLVILFTAGNLYAQQAIVTNNNLSLPGKEHSFQVSILPDSNPAIFNLVIQNPAKKKLQVQISHDVLGIAVDTIIYSEQFSRRYNLSEADDGRYIIAVSSGKEVFSKEVEMNTVTVRNVVIH